MSFGSVAKVDFRPPGTAEIVDNFFYDVSEITNQDWREYVSYYKEKNGEMSKEYLRTLPDTTVWLQKNENNEPFTYMYFRHEAYSYYPVVGITHEQATKYCVWRTQAVKTMMEENNIEGPSYFKYRLPSKTEWELMANAGYDAKGLKAIRKHKDKLNKNNKNARVALTNMKKGVKQDNHWEHSIMKLPAPGRSYIPNKYGIYNINGNVAEMVQESGIAMGGSFDHFYGDIVPTNKAINYVSPQKWLGFRCVCEVSN